MSIPLSFATCALIIDVSVNAGDLRRPRYTYRTASPIGERQIFPKQTIRTEA